MSIESVGIVLMICAGIAWIVAGRKGNSTALGCLLGLLLGPIGVLVTALLPSHLEAQQLRSGAMRACPNCAEIVRAEAKVCRYCLQPLPPLEARPPVPAIAIIVPIAVIAIVIAIAVLWPY